MTEHALDHVAVRRATPADAELLAHLHLDVLDDVLDDAGAGLMPRQLLDDRQDRVAARVERWRELLAGDQPTWVAVDTTAEGELIGLASTGPGRDNDLADDIALELTALYVRAAWWGSGVGYELFRTAVGDRAAYLWVPGANEHAIRFYERQGFRLDGTEDELDEGRHVRMVRAGR
ncbi:GNAT family N-acetyltransferase [Nocardioides pantholopis]|uniref:GNAT family N-acetyltransferase n=1 Tax=Nocardioides pantholopis TaxID=2483798 RepID=UPI0013E3597D|nr:GNAT family N-acetyltransferase [Nocardioides pantholopis]